MRKIKTIQEIIGTIPILQTRGATDKPIKSLCFDTRDVQDDALFVAQKGTQTDGHLFIEQAVSKGAVCIVAEQLPEKLQDNITYLQVKSSPCTLALLASNFYDNPSRKLKLIGITGTNGKTTTATLLWHLFSDLGFKTGLLSTIENKIGQTSISSTHTTADAIQINRLLSQMAEEGCSYCFMEVSSHAIVQQRICGLEFAGGVFTNLTHDHLDYHKTFKEYINAKKLFFDNLPKTAFALANTDDPNGKIMLQNTSAQRKTYSLYTADCDFKAKLNENTMEGINLSIDNQNVWFQLVGKFNAYNLLSIYATAVLLGMDKEEVLQKMSLLKSAKGRFTVIRDKDISLIIDYAHTPDALSNVLQTIQDVIVQDQEIITVVGCGGNRDKSKRPTMAKIACQLSSKVILTSDNPRGEDPKKILNDMLEGVPAKDEHKVFVIDDRKQAIKMALTMAKPKTIVLIAGKGHEKYQEINGVKYDFDDMEIAKTYLQNLNLNK
ncbi:MAG: UDP-N-acetylmuramoyl-L-alanyl-D-glutamate--2,6-diaminopimelate ligase [Bacteroidales bacterium]|jgi:UDP-N-acetylmuramoyl-L-alanyl-D-glutamate--2,6-diaminopimelate ligase|nr:UDP-N-acetylmuramoyl-L-alanyl-D-glutamate--2,6-diaminopimelate ligase [Bacteroidales bacterium]